MKTAAEQKKEILKLFATCIDRNTTSAHDVWSIIHALQDASEFIEDKRYKYRNDLAMSIRYMRERLEGDSEKMLYDDFTDDLQEAIMIAGANAEGLILINSTSMRAELYALSDEYNS